MFNRPLPTWVVIGLLTAAFLTAPGAAGAEDVFKWSNGFKLENEEKGYSLEFGGRIQADYTFASGDDGFDAEFDDGFEFRRARLFFAGRVYYKIKFKAQFDFAGDEVEVKDLFVALDSQVGEVRFGHYHEQFSQELVTSSKYLAFLERSLPVEAFAPGRNSGVGFQGSSGDRWNWGLGYFYDADGRGRSTDGDRTSWTGRVGFRPIHARDGKRILHLGVAVSQRERGEDDAFRFRARPEAHLSPRLVDTGTIPADSATLFGVELAGVRDRLWFAGEYIESAIDSEVLSDPTVSGYYVQVGFFLTPDHRRFKSSDGSFDRQKPGTMFGRDGTGALELAVQVSNLDLNDAGLAGGRQDDLTLAFNWYLNPATRFMFNLERADVDGVGDADFVLVRWQLDF